MMGKPLQVIVLACLFFSLTYQASSLPLSTNGRWIVDTQTGHRVKLSCVNWPSHMQSMLAEGLHRRPLNDIASEVAKLRFNCVRLTYAIHMFTRYANLTVSQSFENIGLQRAKAGIAINNPSLMNMTVVEAYEAVVDSLGAHGVMVVSDNHVSQPMWCCNGNDGNGFFGDQFFDPEEWLKGLGLAAQLLKSKPQVVAMSLRNELRGPHQKFNKWYQYMTQGANLIHQTNPNVLVVVSGLGYDTDLSFIKNRPFGNNLDNKLVFEAHLYSFSDGRGYNWTTKPLNTNCANVNQLFEERAGFLARGQNPVPLFVSEFGIDQSGRDEGQNRFLACFSSYLVQNDFDWALWGLQGNYYLREGIQDFEEFYGVFDSSWAQLRNPNFPQKFQLLQTMLQDPSLNLPTTLIMYHPQSGECVRVDEDNKLRMSNCWFSSQWSHGKDGSPIKATFNGLCLKIVGEGIEPIVSSDCSSPQSVWKYANSSNATLQLAAIDEKGQSLCLEKSSSDSSTIVTNKCLCLDDSQCQTNPQTQWIQLVPLNVPLH